MAVKYVLCTILVTAMIQSGICRTSTSLKVAEGDTCLTLGCVGDIKEGCLTTKGVASCIPVCPMVLCAESVVCPAGRALDENGCSTCSCNPDPCKECPDKCQVVNGQARCSSVCPDLICIAIACPYGRLTGPDGCVTCKCRPAPRSCQDNVCPSGQVCVLKPVTCVTTPCYPQPTCVCPLVKCPTLRCAKQLTCPYGPARDRQGCPNCGCARNPCKRHRNVCGRRQKCIPIPPPSDCECCKYSYKCE